MSLFIYKQRIPQAATWGLFRSLVTAISDLVKFGFNPEMEEKKQKVSTISFMEILSCKTKVVLSAFAE